MYARLQTLPFDSKKIAARRAVRFSRFDVSSAQTLFLFSFSSLKKDTMVRSLLNLGFAALCAVALLSATSSNAAAQTYRMSTTKYSSGTCGPNGCPGTTRTVASSSTVASPVSYASAATASVVSSYMPTVNYSVATPTYRVVQRPMTYSTPITYGSSTHYSTPVYSSGYTTSSCSARSYSGVTYSGYSSYSSCGG